MSAERTLTKSSAIPITSHEGKKYLRTIFAPPGVMFSLVVGPDGRQYHGIEVDVYCVIDAWKVECPALQHALKKILTPGQRGKGDRLADLIGIQAAINRAIELEQLHLAQEHARERSNQTDGSSTSGNDDGGTGEVASAVRLGGRPDFGADTSLYERTDGDDLDVPSPTRIPAYGEHPDLGPTIAGGDGRSELDRRNRTGERDRNARDIDSGAGVREGGVIE